MGNVFRLIGSIVAGLAVAFGLIIAVEVFGSVVHPFPAGFDETDMEQLCQHVERYPPWVLAVVVPAWAGTALASTWITGRIGNQACALLVGLLLLAALIFNLAMLPYPTWFKIANPLAIAAGLRLSKQRHVAAEAARVELK